MVAFRILVSRLCARSARGATFLEAALALPLLLVIAVVIIDLARYVVVWSVLEYAAYRAVDEASKRRIEIDTTEAACAADPSSCFDYYARVNEILDSAIAIARLVAAEPGSSGSVRLLPYAHYDDAMYNTGHNDSGLGTHMPMPLMKAAAFLRPGEAVMRSPEGGIRNAVMASPPRTFGTGPKEGWPQAIYGENWERVLDQYPVMVMLEAEFEPFTPLLPALLITAEQMVYRKVPTPGVARADACGDGICGAAEMCQCCSDCAAFSCGLCAGPAGGGGSTGGPGTGTGTGTGSGNGSGTGTGTGTGTGGGNFCGDGDADPGEECGEPGLVCPAMAGLRDACNDCRCAYFAIKPPPIVPDVGLTPTTTTDVNQRGGEQFTRYDWTPLE